MQEQVTAVGPNGNDRTDFSVDEPLDPGQPASPPDSAAPSRSCLTPGCRRHA